MEQRTEKWHEWRSRGIGSSDAAVIMLKSPYKTPLRLWEEKTGIREPDKKVNPAMQRGIDLEPLAREEFVQSTGIFMEPALAEMKTHPFLIASLDGISSDKKVLLEIKCPGREDHELAKKGVIPAKYVPQVQHQLMVTEADHLFYYSFDGKAGVSVEVLPDYDYHAELLKMECEFWKCVQKKIQPDLTDKDFELVTDLEIQKFFEAYKVAYRAMTAVEKVFENARKGLLSACQSHRARHGGVTIRRSERMGQIEYKRIPELSGVDLEQYRKASSEVTTVTVDDDL